MARRSLRPHLNQIRGWVRQGRTDAWIAHQLEVTVQDIEAFKRQNELLPDGEAPEGPGLDFDDEIDLRAEAEAAGESAEEQEEEKPKPKRSRSRGGRSRKRPAGKPLEGTFDHGEEGYGLWLDPDVQDDPVYAEHWAGHRPVEVTIEEDQIVIRRAGEDAGDDDDD
jgi:hypothetical protein